MSKQEKFEERRRYPRINKCVKLELNADDSTIAAETIDLSCIGASCRANKYISFMTKLKILFPLTEENQKKNVENVEFHGVVVKVDKISSGPKTNDVYKLAIFFNDIEESVREKIADFIERHESHSI